eukprot:m.96532 g.96532  ORF g.96532 m.96532 type:complete len:56 (+) comp12469_c0_seq1:420-587(+)
MPLSTFTQGMRKVLHVVSQPAAKDDLCSTPPVHNNSICSHVVYLVCIECIVLMFL